jgi:deoxyribodipyrimidine photo-lyase
VKNKGVVWFRRDLRLTDNPAWSQATRDHDEVTALFVVDPAFWDLAGENRRNQLAAHLAALDRDLASCGGRLCVYRGDPVRVLPDLARQVAADLVHWNTDVSPYAARRDDAVRNALQNRCVGHPGSWVHPPGSIQTSSDKAYRVFTPFHRVWDQLDRPLWATPGEARVLGDRGDGLPPADSDPLMPPGAAGAMYRLAQFLDRVDRYRSGRLDLDSTSRLSADLKFGTIDPRRLAAEVGERTAGRRAFLRQLAWRDFYGHLMAAYPWTAREEMRPEVGSIPWRADPEALEAWKTGTTGYPMIDAGMRQLLAEGWMPNQVRMVVASFLVKDLLIDWREGERHFRRFLVDGDPAQNVGNWQWVAGTGANAAPYSRIFNPVTQSQRFDHEGRYIKRWVPELRRLPPPVVHAPWEAHADVLEAAGVRLGSEYPKPIVDHPEARREALAAYEAARAGGA